VAARATSTIGRVLAEHTANIHGVETFS
jgi:hypothetical protein